MQKLLYVISELCIKYLHNHHFYKLDILLLNFVQTSRKGSLIRMVRPMNIGQTYQ